MFTRLMVLLLSLLLAPAAGALHPLEPLDTSSPRATMKSFLVLTEEITQRYSDYRNSPSRATQEALIRRDSRAKDLIDLSQVPPAGRIEIGSDSFRLLWEVIARLELPDLAAIPDASHPGDGGKEAAPVTRWSIPRTRITIARVEKGPRAGEFLFSPETVRDARHFYEMTRELPYLRPIPIGSPVRRAELFAGWMIPSRWVEALPDWANTPVLGMIFWKWFVLLLLFGFTFGTVIAVFRWTRRRPWDGSLRSYLRYLSTPLAILVLARLLRFLFWYQIPLTGVAAQAPDYFIHIAYNVAAIWIVWLTASWIAEAIITSPRVRPESLDADLIRLAARSIGLIAIFVLLFRVAYNVGIPVYGLVAGAGVGGLAIALAARSTLEDFLER